MLNLFSPRIDPFTGKPTVFPFSGDPYTGTGWVDDQRDDDRRAFITSGPVSMAPSESQEIVIATLIARGDNRLDSVNKLKHKAAAVKEFYYTGVLPSSIEEEKSAKLPIAIHK